MALIILVGIGMWMQSASNESADDPTITPSPTAIPTETPPTETPIPDSTEIILSEPQPLATVNSPMTITGEARGSWYFEATFPVVLTNWDGLIIAEGYATADGDWMTEEFVPFSATLEFETPDYGERGFLILQKANPSDLPEHDDALEIEIRFQTE